MTFDVVQALPGVRYVARVGKGIALAEAAKGNQPR